MIDEDHFLLLASFNIAATDLRAVLNEKMMRGFLQMLERYGSLNNI